MWAKAKQGEQTEPVEAYKTKRVYQKQRGTCKSREEHVKPKRTYKPKENI